MRVTTRISFDSSGRITEHEWFEYDGPIALAKGSDSARTVRDKEFAMQQQAFNQQMAMMNQLKSAFSPYLSGKVGFSPAGLTAMKSQFLNSNNQTFNQAGQQVREALGARGDTGANPVGGNYARGLSSLLGAKAGSQSQGLLGVDVTNAQQALQNMFNAGSILSGNAATLTGTQGVSGSAMSNALNAFMNAENSGFGANFMRGFGGTLGTGFGTSLIGGFGKALGLGGGGS